MRILDFWLKKWLVFGVAIVCALCSYASAQEETQKETQTLAPQPFDESCVTLAPSPFRRAYERNLEYILALDTNRLLAPYRREAGLPPRAEPYGGWESGGLDGHTAGHYLSALAHCLAQTKDVRVAQRLDYMLDELELCQNATGGWLSGAPNSRELWEELRRGDIRAHGFDLNGRWVPIYNIHKILAGLRDATLVTHSDKAREIFLRYCEWIHETTNHLSDDQIQTILICEHGGINEILADAAALSDEKKFLDLAIRFSDRRILDPLLEGRDALSGLHANTQIPKIIGVKRIADLAKKEDWDRAARFFWQTIVENRSIAIGGNSVREHFHPSDDFSPMIMEREGPETCNTYNMLRLARMLFETSGDARYMDFYERAIFNHILSSQHPETGGVVYFTSMRPGHYRVYSRPQTCFWCCVGTGLENHAKYSEMIYSHAENDIWVNLFIPSRVYWRERGIVLEQSTKIPDEATTRFSLRLGQPTRFGLKIRRPAWADNSAQFRVFINGEPVGVHAEPGSYFTLTREWRDGDEIRVVLPMRVALEKMPNQPFGAFVFGPVVLAAREDSHDLKEYHAGSGRGDHVAHGATLPLERAPAVSADERSAPTCVRRLPGDSLAFALERASKPTELRPFARIHDSRYTIYFRLNPTSGNQSAVGASLQTKEPDWEARIVDQVYCGEQQPETDHEFEGEETTSGVSDGVRWRSAQGWFAYTLRNSSQTAAVLRVEFLELPSADAAPQFLMNNEPIATDPHVDGRAWEFALPQSAQSSESIRFRVSGVGKIVRVVLLTK
ncbi:MAG: glycoside hydrolase family 127 protein [Planctomycetia bacterium]|nr:glycoside hydrolase family 127 protein [Planctomycetia bacterium]